jgi:hypothetical protein
LLEIHPQGRATAAGDVNARFNAAQDIEVRKGAVAAFAYASRLEGGDAGYPAIRAKEKIREYLSAPHTHAFPTEKAMLAANEILAVNAETIGLLVEKGPSEIGFVHASLEEYLAALHIQSWPLGELDSFIRANAADVRWRNVIGNLISITRRPAEIDQHVTAIESAMVDVLGESTKNQLLTDIAFAPSKMSPATASRLGLQSLSRIEYPGAIAERMALLSSALNGLHHSVNGPVLIGRVQTWAPKTLDYSERFFEVLGTWDKAPDLLLALKRGLVEPSRWGQRPAARAIAKVYGNCEDVQQWLMGLLNGTTDLQSTSATIEALVLGWPTTEGIEQIIADASLSVKPNLRALAIWAKVKLGRHEEQHLLELLELLKDSQALDYWDQPLAWETLSTGWLNHPIAIQSCLESVGRHHGMRQRNLDHEKSMVFLLACSPENQSIRQCLINELSDARPFLLIHGAWDCLIPFALADGVLKDRVVAIITNNENLHLDYQISGLISGLKDQRLKDFAIQKIRSGTETRRHVWYLAPLIQEWSSDQEVQSLLNEIRAWPNERLENLVSLLPKILPGRADCRNRLLALHRGKKHHLKHHYPAAFAEIGCGATDQEVVIELVSAAKSNRLWGGAESLIHHFGANPKVQNFARELLADREPPVAAIASEYAHVQDIRTDLFSRVGALPASLRYILADVASIESEHHSVMAKLLNRYDWEVDGDLKVLLSIRHHELLKSSSSDATKAIETLLTDVRAIGPDLDVRRAAAVAGLIALGSIKAFVDLSESDKPLAISVGSYSEESTALLELIARRWDELKEQLGESLIERIGRHSSLNSTWDSLAPYLTWNNRLRQEFVSYCELTDASLGIPSLRALARERPKSDLLERHCLHSVMPTDGQGARSPWHGRALAYEAAYILRDQFGNRSDISNQLHDAFIKRQNIERAVMLGIYDAEHTVFGTLKIPPLALGAEQHHWLAACTISAGSQESVDFVEVLRAMINRDTHNLWDFQEYINTAVLARLARDPESVNILWQALADDVTSCEAASLPRYLAAIGPIEKASLAILRAKLDFFSQRKGVVVAGYDALANEIRPISHSLLDALQ